MGHAGKEIWGKGMSGEPVVPAQKKKQVCDVCGAITDHASSPKKIPPNPRVFRYNIRIGK